MATAISSQAWIWLILSSFPIFNFSFQILQHSNTISGFSVQNCYYYSYIFPGKSTACTTLHDSLFILTCHTAISSWVFQELATPEKRWSQEKAASSYKEPSPNSAGLEWRGWSLYLHNYNISPDLSWDGACPCWIINSTFSSTPSSLSHPKTQTYKYNNILAEAFLSKKIFLYVTFKSLKMLCDRVASHWRKWYLQGPQQPGKICF